jgi:hypothetical protein
LQLGPERKIGENMKAADLRNTLENWFKVVAKRGDMTRDNSSIS